MTRRLGVFSLFLGAAAMVALYLHGRGNGSQPAFLTAAVERGPLTSTVATTGTLNAVTTVQVGTEVSGQIRELLADFNSQVNRNQVIARIAPESFEAKVAQVRAELDAAEAGVVNQRAQVERARADLATAEAQVLNQRSQVERARAELDNAHAGLAAARAQTAKAAVVLLDTKRDLIRKMELFDKALISRSEADSAQAGHDSAAALLEASRAQEQALESTIRSAEAQLASAKAQEQALGSGIRAAEAQLEVTQAQQKQAEANVRQKHAALDQALVDLDHTYIRSPVDGIVIARSVDVGQTVAASLAAPTLFTIAQDLTRMQIDTNVDESDIGRIEPGQRATFTVDTFPGERFTGKVSQVRKAAKVVQNVVTYNVVIGVDNPGRRLLPGMTTTIRIAVASTRDALKVPNAALRYRPDDDDPDPARSASPPARDDARSRATTRVLSLAELRADLTRTLVLTPEQQKRLEPVLRQRQQQLIELERVPKEERARAVTQINDATRARVRALLTPEQQALYDEYGHEGRKRSGRPGIVWTLEPGRKPQPIWLTLGITDGSFTEVLAGDLTEGQPVVVADAPGSGAARLFSPIEALRFR
jgi:HlyD family secretion protein